MQRLTLPEYYWENDFREFEDFIREWGHPMHFDAGEVMFGVGIFP